MRLRRNEYCPVHKSLSCCGRELLPNRPRQIRLGVQRVEDPRHPRGYRELRFAGRNAEAPEPENCRAGQEVCHLSRRVHGLQRHRPGPQGPQRDGRSVAG